MPSFAQQVKNELARRPFHSSCCGREEMRAFLEMAGKLVISKEKISLVLVTESASVARRLFSFLKLYFEEVPEVLYGQRNKLKKKGLYLLQLSLPENSLELLRRMELPPAGFFKGKDRNSLFSSSSLKKCCRRAYLRGAFLATGSLNNPERGYHLEILAPYESYAKKIKDILASFGISSRYFERKGDYVVYLKEGEKIGEFLRVVEAHRGLMEFENIRVVKGIRNKANRLVNCETANLTRTAFASHEQITNINLIRETIGLENIPPALRQVAQLRLEHPEATLKELGGLASPPLTKSSVNHRMRRLNALAHKVKERQEAGIFKRVSK